MNNSSTTTATMIQWIGPRLPIAKDSLRQRPIAAVTRRHNMPLNIGLRETSGHCRRHEDRRSRAGESAQPTDRRARLAFKTPGRQVLLGQVDRERDIGRASTGQATEMTS